jgi:hypothetical protein
LVVEDDGARLAGHPAAALREYRISLQTNPGRFDTLLHAGEVAEELGSRQEATEYYRLLLKNAAHPSVGSRRVLGRARSYLQSRKIKSQPVMAPGMPLAN